MLMILEWFPEWLTSEKYITLATWGLVFVTILLVVATIVLYIDSRAKGKEQRVRWEREDVLRAAEQKAQKERWEREDALRATEQKSRWEREDQLREEDTKPKVAVEIAKKDDSPEIVFNCFNLGTTIFFIDKMIVTVTHGPVHTSDLVGPPVLLQGNFVSTPYDCTELLTDALQEANVVFILRGMHGHERTEPVWFHFFPHPTLGYGWTIGRLSDRLPGTIVPQPRIPERQ